MERDVRVQEIELPGGERVLASVSVLEPGRLPDGGSPDEEYEFEDTAAFDGLTARIDQLNELVSGVGSAVLNAARSARPDEVSATFGIELAAKPGRAVALLADGQVKGAISVTLTWKQGAETRQEEQ
ncbi:CU044_2847 family protein [Streptomyces winkii]|uniref:CU044_2847 family protein n=1 Tax=Streptomyces winkii TaxID=3051178 RepID=UPI0028D4D7DE|nr:CU044_2847 family protein [Streptomyces sp. DSM 40971]